MCNSTFLRIRPLLSHILQIFASGVVSLFHFTLHTSEILRDVIHSEGVWRLLRWLATELFCGFLEDYDGEDVQLQRKRHALWQIRGRLCFIPKTSFFHREQRHPGAAVLGGFLVGLDQECVKFECVATVIDWNCALDYRLGRAGNTAWFQY